MDGASSDGRAAFRPASTRAARLGIVGEDAAAAAYRRAGYRVIARNWRCPLGELDLVAARGRTLVVCEVKARRSGGGERGDPGDRLGGPHDAVTWRKQRRLRRLAEAFLAASGLAPDEVRFDVASVTVGGAGRPSVHLFRDAF